MDFVCRLLLTPTKKDSVWVIVDRLTKSAHFLHIWTDYTLQKLVKLYVGEIVRLHGVPVSIFSFTRLDFNTAYHPQTDEQFKRVIQILEDMLRNCIIDFKGNWEDHLPLTLFAYNNSFQSNIQMAPYGTSYGRKCRTALCWTELDKRRVLGPKLVSELRTLLN